MKEKSEAELFSQAGSSCCFKPYIGPNPITAFNPVERYPSIEKSAFISPFSSVIGDVAVMENTFIAPNVSIRADEGTPFFIGANTNLQDGVILHGPCYIGDKAFFGFKAIVYNAIVEPGAFVSYNAVITNGVTIPSNRFVPPCAHIDTQEKADALSKVPNDSKEFAKEVQRVNQEFPASYHLLFGNERCSCGFAFN